MVILVDHQTLSGVLRGDLDWPDDRIFTTGHWYLRLCQAVVRSAGGALSRPLLALPEPHRRLALAAVLELPERIEILSWRQVARIMASQLDGPGQGLNLLSREALAVATILQAKVVMAPQGENPLRTALERVGLVG